MLLGARGRYNTMRILPVEATGMSGRALVSKQGCGSVIRQHKITKTGEHYEHPFESSIGTIAART